MRFWGLVLGSRVWPRMSLDSWIGGCLDCWLGAKFGRPSRAWKFRGAKTRGVARRLALPRAIIGRAFSPLSFRPWPVAPVSSRWPISGKNSGWYTLVRPDSGYEEKGAEFARWGARPKRGLAFLCQPPCSNQQPATRLRAIQPYSGLRVQPGLSKIRAALVGELLASVAGPWTLDLRLWTSVSSPRQPLTTLRNLDH